MSPHRGGNIIPGPVIDRLADAIKRPEIDALQQQIKDLTQQLASANGELRAFKHKAHTLQQQLNARTNERDNLQTAAAAARERRAKLIRENAELRSQVIRLGHKPWKPARLEP
jgi:chromosome segregation ATPase